MLPEPKCRHPDKEAPRASAQTRRLGATLGATRMNDLAILRTCTDNRHRVARGHELIWTGSDARPGIYGSDVSCPVHARWDGQTREPTVPGRPGPKRARDQAGSDSPPLVPVWVLRGCRAVKISGTEKATTGPL